MSEKLPPTVIQTYSYAAIYLNEIKELAKAISIRKNQRLVFQTLPKHMRRRAMSHHPNRLPRNKRAAHISQMSKTAPPVITKRPSRLYRRRPRRLMCDYVRRMRRHTWLETHLWHARRFKMVERWGYKLAYRSTEKTYRACYNASKDQCLLQDMSFMCCIQLHGNLSKLLEGFTRLTNDNCGLGMSAQTYLTGNREGIIDLFRDKKYPFSALARVQFMWRPAADEENDFRTLWLWVHPSVSTILLEELINVFELRTQKTIKVPLDAEELTDLRKEEKQQELIYKTVTKLSCFQETYYMNHEQDITLTSLKNKLNRFRLTGAKSFHLLKSILKIDCVQLSDQSAQSYWDSLCKDNTALECLLPNSIIALTVKNPILERASGTLNFTDNSNCSQDVNKLLHERLTAQPYLPRGSGLWCKNIREEFTRSFIKARRSNNLNPRRSAIPGKQLIYVHKNLQPMPILLLQRTGAQRANYKRLSYGAGWDIILPNGAGMHIWLSLIMRGARAGGLRETETMMREMGIEEQLPDTIVGRVFAAEEQVVQEQQYFKLPTNKRINFCAIGMRYPFRIPYAQLVKDWSAVAGEEICKEFHVLRERKQLLMLQECLNAAVKGDTDIKIPEQINRYALIQVQVLLHKRGMMSNNSLICLPNEALHMDTDEYERIPKKQKHDTAKKERRRLRKEHNLLLKRMRARRVRQKRKLQETSNKRVHIAPAQTSVLCAQHATKMRNLWLPTSSYNSTLPVRKLYADIEVCGFVSSCHFCYTEGLVSGVAYIALNAMQEIINKINEYHFKKPLVIVRDKNTAVDRTAIININLDV